VVYYFLLNFVLGLRSHHALYVHVVFQSVLTLALQASSPAEPDRAGASAGHDQAPGVFVLKGVKYDKGVPDSDVLVGLPVLVDERLVEFVQHLQAFAYLAKNCVLAVEVRAVIFAESDEKSGCVQVRAFVGHSNEPFLIELSAFYDLIVEVALRRVLVDDAPDGGAFVAFGVCALDDVVLLDLPEEGIIVALDFAEFEEIEGCFGTFFEK